MAKLVSASAQASLAAYGKGWVGTSMFAKGKAFLAAAVLIDRHGDREHIDYVFLHLLCQGCEVTLKGLLLLRDYDLFIRRLKSPIGHNLRRLAREASIAFGIKPLRPPLATELTVLSNLYSGHLLRYGSGHDILVDPRTIQRKKVVSRLWAVIRLAEREIARANALQQRKPLGSAELAQSNIEEGLVHDGKPPANAGGF